MVGLSFLDSYKTTVNGCNCKHGYYTARELEWLKNDKLVLILAIKRSFTSFVLENPLLPFLSTSYRLNLQPSAAGTKHE